MSLAETIADNAAETDEIAEDRAEEFAARFYELLHFPVERDPDMWEDAAEAVGIDPEWTILSLADFNSVELSGRGLAWQMGHALTIAAAREQAFTEVVVRDLIDAAEGHAQAVDKADTAEVRETAKKGIKKDDFEAAKERRKAGRDGKATP